MLHKAVLTVLLLLATLPAWAAPDNPWLIHLPFEKATIEYRLSGIEQGGETLYLRDHGRQRARYHRTTMLLMGMKKHAETVEFIDPEWIYTFDLIERTGVKAVNPQKYLLAEYARLSSAEKKQVLENSEKMSAGPLVGGLSAEVERGAAEILGFRCDRVSLMDSTVYSMAGTGLPLKIESKMMGMENLTEAVSLEPGQAPDEYFRHPEAITPVLDPDSEAVARLFARETISMLKDPEAVAKARSRPGPGMQQQLKMTPEEQRQMEQAMEALKNIFGN